MIQIKDNIVENSTELPKWWTAGQQVRIIPKGENAFFIYKYAIPKEKSSRSIGIVKIAKDGTLELKTIDGWYDVLVHSEVCVRLIFNRGLDVDKNKDIPVDDIDPRTADVYDLNYWFFKKAQTALKNDKIPKGFADAVKVMRESFHAMKLERRGITSRPMETREIIVEDDDEQD